MQEARQRQGIDNRGRNARQAIAFITGIQKAHVKADVVSSQQTAFTKVLEHLKDLSFRFGSLNVLISDLGQFLSLFRKRKARVNKLIKRVQHLAIPHLNGRQLDHLVIDG